MTKEDILHHFQDINFRYNDCMMYDDLSRMLDELIAENKGEWIPVSERLPEYGVEVLCTVREMCDFPDDNEYDVPLTFIAQGHYINHEQKIFRGWYIKVRPDCSMGTDKVIAWMPLPEPYKAEKGGE